MKIIITGSAGFIGYHLSKKLLEKNSSSENTNKQTQNNSTFKKSIIEKINKN